MATGIYYSDVCLQHDTGSHPESRARLEAIVERLRNAPDLGTVEFVEAEPATVEEIKEIHTPSYVDRVVRIASLGGDWLDGDTIVSRGSVAAALRAAGGSMDAAVAVATGALANAFVAVRPPGHHATAGQGMGFCLFNNVALAAHRLLAEGLAERVAVVDFDVHHGNGTQDIFYSDPRVLAFSVHQMPLYPGTGRLEETGKGPGTGFTANVPLPPGTGDEGYVAVMEELLGPLLRRFQPDFLLVPSGYDGHWRDPLANMRVTTEGFRRIVEQIKSLADELCGGKLVCTLEGGYDLQTLASSVEATIRALAGSEVEVSDPYGRPNTVNDPASIDPIIAQARKIHKLTEQSW